VSNNTSIGTAIDKLGGIKPVEDKFYPLSEVEITELEKEIGSKLPEDYAWLLQTYGAFMFTNSVQFKSLNNEPEYKHPEELGIPNGYSFSGSEVTMVYGKNTRKGVFTVLEKLKTYRDRMPEKFLPFADDGLGNQLCLDFAPENYQKVWWWDHELEWDADDYEDETGTAMPAAAKFQNVYLVANSLAEFFGNLSVSASADE
jgi:hypothetical protein